MLFSYNDAAAIPLETGQAVSPGWPSAHGGQPRGVTWHWTVTGTLKLCRDVLGGRSAERRGEASAHYGVGRSFSEGVDRYVSLENRSWHAGKNQLLRWDGKALTGPDWISALTLDGNEGAESAVVTRGRDRRWASMMRTLEEQAQVCSLNIDAWSNAQVVQERCIKRWIRNS